MECSPVSVLAGLAPGDGTTRRASAGVMAVLPKRTKDRRVGMYCAGTNFVSLCHFVVHSAAARQPADFAAAS